MTEELLPADVIKEVREYISGTMLVGLSDEAIEPDESLVQRGVVDSTGVLELVSFLETRFGISVKDDEITLDNLDTLNSISTYVQQKRMS